MGVAIKYVCWSRLTIAALLVGAVVIQLELDRFVRAETPPAATRLRGPLAGLPLRLGSWQGVDVPVPNGVGVGDDHLHRVYRQPTTGQDVTVWITYSARGEDRGHHPQVCMAVAGKTEDVGRRAEVVVPGGGAPIAESFFGPATDGVQTWYWHYALPTDGRAWHSPLTRIYYRARERSASVTLELLTAGGRPTSTAAARQLALLVDQALRPLLPAGAVRGSERLPVEVAP